MLESFIRPKEGIYGTVTFATEMQIPYKAEAENIEREEIVMEG